MYLDKNNIVCHFLLQIDIWARVSPRLKINSLTFTKLFFLHFKIRNLIQKTLRIQYHKFIACENNILRSCWAFCLQSKCLLKVNYLYLTCLFSKRIIYYSKKLILCNKKKLIEKEFNFSQAQKLKKSEFNFLARSHRSQHTSSTFFAWLNKLHNIQSNFLQTERKQWILFVFMKN